MSLSVGLYHVVHVDVTVLAVMTMKAMKGSDVLTDKGN